MNDSELYLLLIKWIGFLIGWSTVFTIPWIRLFVRMFKYGIHNGREEVEE
jgi:hypothetical protein